MFLYHVLFVTIIYHGIDCQKKKFTLKSELVEDLGIKSEETRDQYTALAHFTIKRTGPIHPIVSWYLHIGHVFRRLLGVNTQ